MLFDLPFGVFGALVGQQKASGAKFIHSHGDYHLPAGPRTVCKMVVIASIPRFG
jgi:hypothetical protein